MKEKINLRNKKIILLSALASILVIIGIVSYIFNKPKVNNVLYSSELERAEIEQMRTYDKVEKDDSKIENCPNVEFDAFFTRDLDGDGYSEGIRGSCIQIGKEDILYMELHINDGGIFKNGKITINNDNFYLDTALPKSDDIKEHAISNNTKEIFLTETNTNNGTGKQITLIGSVRSGNYDSPRTIAEAIGNDTTKMSNNLESENRNSVTLTGTYEIVNEDGESVEIEINKTVYFNLDWYGTTSTSLPNYLGNGNYNYKKQEYDIKNILDEENEEIHLDFKILTRENDYQLNLSNSEIKMTLPELQEYSPIRVEAEGAEVEYIYDESNNEKIVGAIISKKAVLDENNTIKENAYTDIYSYTNAFYRYNIFNIKVTYPIDAYKKIGADAIQLRLPIEAHYEGYNNPNSEFENPYKSNAEKDIMIVTFRNPSGNAAYFWTYVGNYYGSPWRTYLVPKKNPINVYNGISENIGNDTYQVLWYGTTGSEGKSDGLILAETEIGQKPKNSDQFITSTGKSISMEGAVKNVGIRFTGAENLLGEDGWIKVYDDDDDDELAEPLMTFTKDNWNDSYSYPEDKQVPHIRIETSSTNADSYFYVYNIKEIDTDYIVDNYTKEEFLDYKYIQSRVYGYLNSGARYINLNIHQASYEPSISLTNVSVSESKIPTTEEKNLRLYINTDISDNKEKWVNGIFLLKLPQEMASVEINNVTISNSNVKISSRELYKENDETFIKIITENIDPQSYTITVDCNVMPDATALSSTKSIELYAINEYCTNYHSSYSAEDIYDINKNSNFNELVNYTTTGVQFVSTNNLLTSQIITDYDGSNITYAPSVAGVVKVDRTARVNIKINNNYSGTNSEVVILGRTPFEGNKYVDSGRNMNSTFTAIMSNNGIIVPDALKNAVTVYYSENGEATRDFNEDNNWQTVPTDYTKVKSYMIKFNDDYKLQRGEKHEFYYDVTIPQDVALNAESYSHHAVYFCWDTEQGKYPTKVEPSKIGISPIEKFNLELTKYQTGFDKLVPGATYSFTEVKTLEDGEELVNSRTETTDENGKLLITGLYVNRVYEIKEVKTPEGYELNEDIIRISTAINSETKELTVEKITGNTRGDIAVSQEERKISIQVEDETKAKLRLVKSEKGKEDTKLANARFTITGEGLPTAGKLIKTNAEGMAELSGLKIGSTYTIEETKSPSGYYLLEEPINFKIINNNDGSYRTEIENKENINALNNISTVIEEDTPITIINLTNEKIPIFKLIKTEEKTDLPLARVKYKLFGKGISEKGTTLTTNDNGEIVLASLYLNEEYTIYESKSLEGYYIKPEFINFKIVNDNGNYSLQITKGKEIIKSTETTDTNGVPTLVLRIDNTKIPTFNLEITKIEKDKPDVLLTGAKFRIYRDDKLVAEAISNEQGKLVFEGLYQYVEEKQYIFDSTYTLKEVESPQGYVAIKDITFKVQEIEGKLNYIEVGENANTSRSYALDENTIKLVLEDTPTFKLIKVDGEQTEEVRLPNTEFVIYNIDGNEQIEVGKYTTDENGEFKVELPEGFYKAVEVNVNNDKYELNTQPYYFGIGKSKKSIELKINDIKQIIASEKTTDEGYINSIGFSQDINLGNGEPISPIGSDCLVVKYDSLGNLEWYSQISGDNNEYIENYVQEINGEFVVTISFNSNSINIVNNVGNNVIVNNRKKGTNVQEKVIIKYDKDGNVTDTILADIKKMETMDKGYILYGTFEEDRIDLGNTNYIENNNEIENSEGKHYSNGFIAKYNENNQLEWKRVIQGKGDVELYNITETANGIFSLNGYYNHDYTYDVSEANFDFGDGEKISSYGNTFIAIYNNGGILYKNIVDNLKLITNDGEVVISKTFSGTITLDNGENISSETSRNDAVIIKYNKDGNMQWYKQIGAKKENSTYNSINHTFETVDNGYIVNVYVEYTNEKNNLSSMNLIIKFDCNGNIQWEKNIENDQDYSTQYFNFIYSISECDSNGYVFVGRETYDGEGYKKFIVKLDKKGNIQWRQILADYDNFNINTVMATNEKIIILINKYDNNKIDLGNNVILNDTGYYVVQYSNKGLPEFAIKNNVDYLNNWKYDIGTIIEIIKEDKKEVQLADNIKIKAPGNYYIKYGIDGNIECVSQNFINHNVYDNMTIENCWLNEEQTLKFKDGTTLEGPLNYAIKYNKDGNKEYAVNGNIYINNFEDGVLFERISIDDEETITLENGTTITGPGHYNIKYKNDGTIEHVVNGYIYINLYENGSKFEGYQIIDEQTLELSNGEKIVGPGYYTVKYNKEGNIEWVINGFASRYVNEDGTIEEYYEIDNEKAITLENGRQITGPGYYTIFYNSDGSEKEIYNAWFRYEQNTVDEGRVVVLVSDKDITLENGEVITCKEGNYIQIILKYNKENTIEWHKVIEKTDVYQVHRTKGTKDNGWIELDYVYSEEPIQFGNGIIIEDCNDKYVMIKYDSKGTIQWAEKICNINDMDIFDIKESENGEILIESMIWNEITLEDGTIVRPLEEGYNNLVLLTYNQIEKNEDNPIVEYAKSVEGKLDDCTGIVISTRDGGYITGESHIEKLTVDTESGLLPILYRIVKYDKNGQKIWETIELDNTPTSICETSDNEYLVLLSNGRILKVDNNGIIVWQHDIENSNQTESRAVTISNLSRGWCSIIETTPGEYIVAGSYSNDTIDLGNGIVLENNYATDDFAINRRYSNGIIIKYKENEARNGCDAIWAKQIEGTRNDEVISVIGFDNKIIAGANFSSTIDIDLGNGLVIPNNSGNNNGVIIQYDYDGNAQSYNMLDNSIRIFEKTTDGYVTVSNSSMLAQANQSTQEALALSKSNEKLSSGYRRTGVSEVIKYDRNGSVEWNKSLENISVNSIEQTKDGGYIIGGNEFESRDTDVAEPIGESRAADTGASTSSNGIILKLNRDGNEEWRREIEESVIYDATQIEDTGYIAVGCYTAENIKFENGIVLENQSDTYREITGEVWNEETEQYEYIYSDEENYYSDGMIIKLNAEMMIPERQELTVKNYYKRFNITTEVELVNGVKGGSITGEGLMPYEEVVYGNTSTKPITMTPEDEKYEIVGITVNGEDYPFEVEADGSVTMPQFENVTEDKHIVVKYCYKENKIIINKVDSETGEPLEGAIFEISPKKLELTDKNLTDMILPMTNNVTYRLKYNANGGSSAPDDQTSYSTDESETFTISDTIPTRAGYKFLGWSENRASTYADIYAEDIITLTSNEPTKTLYAVWNIDNNVTLTYIDRGILCQKDTFIRGTEVTIKSAGAVHIAERNGYVFLGWNTNPSATVADWAPGDSMRLNEDSIFYAVWRKESTAETYQMELNSIENTIAEQNNSVMVYGFVKAEDGTYKSNNQGQGNSKAISYIPLDLTGYTGSYTLDINASISSEKDCDMGYIIVTEQDIENVNIFNTAEAFVEISGNKDAQDYYRYLEGGRKYNIIFGYYKDENDDKYEDTFTINSVKIMQNDVETYFVETNNEGQGMTSIPFGEYTITEIEAPEGYILNTNPAEINFRPAENGEDADTIHTFTFENIKKPKVIVHYYKLEEKDSPNPEPLIDDVILTGNPNEPYTTEIIKNLEKDGIEYELENTILDDGTKTYVIPDNSTGKFKLGEDQEVFYYYVEKKTPLIVHHYIQGTEVGVPLVDGTNAKDERSSGKEGEDYTTSQLLYAHELENNRQLLSKEYKFVEAKGETSGTYGKEEIVVTYYYKKIDANVSIYKYAKQKQINEETGEEEEIKVPLQGAEFKIVRTDTAENTSSAEAQIRDTNMADDMVDNSKENANTNSDANTNTLESAGILISETKLPQPDLPRYITNENGMIEEKFEYGEYVAIEVKAPEGYEIPKTEDGKDVEYKFTINGEEDNINLEVENKKPQGEVITYHYQLDENGNPTEIPVQIKDGENLINAPEESQIGDVGSWYTTSQLPAEKLPIDWKYVKSDGQTSGTYEKDKTIIVKYYYRKIDFSTETINLKLTKIWQEDNEVQALRRPRRIKFIVTSSIDATEQITLNEQAVSQGNSENQLPQEDFETQVSQETITNGEVSKEAENKQETNTESISTQEVASEGVENAQANSEDTKEQETIEENDISDNKEKSEDSAKNSVTDELNNTVSTNEVNNETVGENNVQDEVTESSETPIMAQQTESAPSESIPDENTTLENSSTPDATITTLEEYYCYIQVGKTDKTTEYTFENLPKYDSTTGKLIHYTVDESWDDEEGSDGTEDDLKFYKKQVGEVIPVTDVEGNTIYTARIINTFTIPDDNLISIKGIKEWNDRSNTRDTRPQSIVLQLIGRINKTDENNNPKQESVLSIDQEISSKNNWEHTFEGIPMYTQNGQKIEYSIDELEKIEGDLKPYSKTITTNEDKSIFTITNTLNIQGSNITKTGTEILRTIDGKVNYTINYNVELDINYSQDEDIVVTIVDNLPYKISEKERNIAGGVYDENAKTITWTGTYNTKSEEQVVVWADGSKTPVTFSEEKQVKVVTFNKTISFSYLGITPNDKDAIINNVVGTIKLEKSEETVEDNCTTIIDWKKDVIVNKMWVGDTESTRPDSITVQLKQVVEDENGNESFVEIQNERYKNPITIEKTMENEETEWTYTYKNLPRYDADEKEIKYTVVETEVDGYYCEKTEEVKDGNTIITLTNNAYGSITLTKVDSRNEELKLAGAEFKLERVIKEVNEEGKINWRVPEEGSEDYFVTTGTTGDEGTLKFENLKYGFYKLTETKAPEDYRISKEEIKVIEVNSSDEDHLNAKVTVGNDKKYSLPLTGGYGTNIIRNIGILIISLVAILFTNRKKVVPVKREKASKPKRRK